jgi:signal transduction histidine kinase
VAQNPDGVIVFNAQKELLNIGKQVFVLEDKAGKLTIEDIQKPDYQKLFKKSIQDIPNFNNTTSKIWVKFIVQNKTNEKIYLEVAQALAWYIDFYKQDSVGRLVLTTQTGMMQPIQNREVNNNFFLFELSKNPQPQTYYFSIKCEVPLIIPLAIGTTESLFEYRYPYVLFFGIFSGLMIIMFCYNLFIYFSVRDKIYLYYCGYLFLSLFIFNFFSGNYIHHWNIIFYFPKHLLTFAFCNSLLICLFLLRLLSISKKQLFFKVSILYILINLLFICFNWVLGHFGVIAQIAQMGTLSFYLYVFFYSIWQYQQGNTNARFVVFGFSFYLFGIIVHILQNFSLLPTNFFTYNAIILGTSVEVLLFSLALANRINIIQKAVETSQNALLEQIKANEKLIIDQNFALEQKVTERTESLNQQTEQLSIANQTKDKLFSIIGHDLRNPIASLSSLLDLIAKNHVSHEEFKLLAPELQRNVKNMFTTLENLLQWSKTQLNNIETNPQRLVIQDLIQEQFGLFEATANKKTIQLISQLSSCRCEPYADQNHVRLVLRNLIGNALKFTHEGGLITISCHNKLQNTNPMIEVVITDTGIGMSSNNIIKIFDKGETFTTYGTTGEKGTGLGLLLCKEMIEKNGGQIWVESEIGKGSSFHFTLPID